MTWTFNDRMRMGAVAAGSAFGLGPMYVYLLGRATFEMAVLTQLGIAVMFLAAISTEVTIIKSQ